MKISDEDRYLAAGQALTVYLVDHKKDESWTLLVDLASVMCLAILAFEEDPPPRRRLT